MSSETYRKIKAILFISLLVAAEAQHVGQDVRFVSGTSSPSHNSSAVGSATGHAHHRETMANRESWANWDLPEARVPLPAEMEALVADPRLSSQAERVAQRMAGAEASSPEQLAERMEVIIADPDFWEQAKRASEQVEAMMLDGSLKTQAARMVEEIKNMKAPDPKSGDQVKLVEGAKRAAEKMEAVLADTALEGQAACVTKQVRARAAKSSLRSADRGAAQPERAFAQIRQRAKREMELMLADRNLQEQAQRAAQRLEAKHAAALEAVPMEDMMADPTFREHARQVTEQIQAMVGEPTFEASIASIEAKEQGSETSSASVDAVVDQLLDRLALKTASGAPYEGLDSSTLGKHGSPRATWTDHAGSQAPSDMRAVARRLSFQSAQRAVGGAGRMVLGHSRPRSARSLTVGAATDLKEKFEKVGAAVDRLPPAERKAVESAAEKLGARVTAGDVAAEAGLPLAAADRALQAIALDAEASLEVSNDGQIVYALPQDFRSRAAGKSLRSKIEPAAEKASAVLGYVTRVGFGTCLVLSVVIVTTALVVVATASSQQRDDRDDRDDRAPAFGGGGGYYFGPRFYYTDFFDFYYWSPNYYREQRRVVNSGEEMGFLPSVFSAVFGDGNPNEDLEDRRWEAVASAIVKRDGVVAAEELAPFLDGPGADGETALEESYVLEALQRFEGEAAVSNDGQLVYKFPSLMTSAGGRANPYAGLPMRELKERADEFGLSTTGLFDRQSLEEALVALPKGRPSRESLPYLYEEPWQFSAASNGQKIWVAVLGALNLFGIAALTNQLANPRTLYLFARAAPGFAKITVAVLPFLKVYAIFIVLFPLLRLVLNWKRNKEIEERNTRRFRASQRLQANTDPDLRAKIEAARGSARSAPVRKEVRKSDVVFESGKEFDNRDALDDFDKRLKELDK